MLPLPLHCILVCLITLSNNHSVNHLNKVVVSTVLLHESLNHYIEMVSTKPFLEPKTAKEVNFVYADDPITKTILDNITLRG